jgi:cytochrome P450
MVQSSHLTPLQIWRLLRQVRDSSITSFPSEAFGADVLEFRLLWQRFFIVNDPRAIKHVVLDNAGNYIGADIGRRLLEPGLGRGLLTSEGTRWRRLRRILAPAFDPRHIAGYAPIMADGASKLMDKWDSLPLGTEIDAAATMMEVTLETISKTMFSCDSDEVLRSAQGAVALYQSSVRPGLLDLIGAPDWLTTLANPNRGRGILSDFTEMVDRMISARADNSRTHPSDLLGRLISARDEETGCAMTPHEVRDQVMTIFMSGHDTTALALTWTLYLLSQHPDVENKLHNEVDLVLHGRIACYDDLVQLRYTRQVISESIRLYPPLHTLTRQAVGDDEILSNRIPAGSVVMISPWLLHRKARLWDGPERFDPDRFSPERSAARDRFAYIPFGIGPRTCIGKEFAIVEAMLVLATIAQRYCLRLRPGHPVEPQALISLRPRYGMPMSLHMRRQAGRPRSQNQATQLSLMAEARASQA